jgi:hypothetical protein
MPPVNRPGRELTISGRSFGLTTPSRLGRERRKIHSYRRAATFPTLDLGLVSTLAHEFSLL